MSKRRIRRTAISVRQRLLNIIRAAGDDPYLVWSRYASERLLYRLSVSKFADDFILKGAMLFMAWTGRFYRPTVDLDLMGRGENSSSRTEALFREVASISVEDDGLDFISSSVKASPIRVDQKYKGLRVSLLSYLGKARIHSQVDIGFGDAVIPRARKMDFPTLLDHPAPRIKACPRETVVAEKFQTVVSLGIANSRMKDFYDLYVLAREFDFEGSILLKAIRATFKTRKTEIPMETPLALTDDFGQDNVKVTQWRAFVRKNGLEQSVPDLLAVLRQLREFMLPVVHAAGGDGGSPGRWKPPGPWTE